MIKKGWITAIKALVLFIVVKFVVVLLLSLLGEAFTAWGIPDLTDTSTLMSVSTLISSLLILVILYFWRPVWSVPDRFQSLPPLFFVGLTVLGLLSIGLNSFVLSFFVESQEDLLKQSYFILDSGFVGIFGVVILVPLVEELIFRRVMIESISEQSSPLLAVVISALIFGSLHGQPVQMLGATLLGLVFGWMYYLSGSIVPSTLLHILNNGYFVLALYLKRADGELSPSVEEELFSMQHSSGIYIALLLLILFLFLGRRLTHWSRQLKSRYN